MLCISLIISGEIIFSKAWSETILPECQTSSFFNNCFGRRPTKDGGIYSGEFKEDKYHGQGEVIYPDGFTIKGAFKDGMMHGIITTQMPQTGTLRARAINGEIIEGELTFNNGDKYTGGYKNGTFNGNGIFIKSNGEIYNGNFVNGKFDGKGSLKYSNGESYEGFFKNGKLDGKGIFRFNSGEFYNGEYKEGKKSGLGTLYSKLGDEVYAGIWEDDIFRDYACIGYAIRNTSSIEQDGAPIICFKTKNMKGEEIEICPAKKIIDDTIQVSQSWKTERNLTVVCEKGGYCWNASDFLFSASCERQKEPGRQKFVEIDTNANERICMRWQVYSGQGSRCIVHRVEPAEADRNGQPQWHVHYSTQTRSGKGGAGTSGMAIVSPSDQAMSCGGGSIKFSFYNC